MLGFTKREKVAIVFLLCSFCAGLFLYWYRAGHSPLPHTAGMSFSAASDICADTLDDAAGRKEPVSVDVNSADTETLKKLPGVGDVTAARILEYREAHGPFNTENDLLNVRGIGQKTLARMKPYLCIKKNN